MYISPEGEQFQKRYGSRISVWEGISYQTSSGLKRKDLKENRRGKIVSIRRSSLMLERYKKFGGLSKIKEEIKEERRDQRRQKRSKKKEEINKEKRREIKEKRRDQRISSNTSSYTT